MPDLLIYLLTFPHNPTQHNCSRIIDDIVYPYLGSMVFLKNRVDF